jgi:peptidoglycan/LPS O-acetylase OafA/YrhL
MLMLYIVLIIHGLFWLDLLPEWVSSWLLFEMPLMFIVSGYAYYLYENSRPDRSINIRNSNLLLVKDYFSFLTSRFIRILVPYAIYAATCVVSIYLLALFGQGNDYSLSDLILAWINPVNYGRGYSFKMLNWHLWFIPVFLIVTAAMPIATKFRPIKNPNLLSVFVGVVVIQVVVSKADFPGENTIKQAAFYLVFSLLGYYMARSGEYFRGANFSRIAIVAVIALASIAMFGGGRPMNMQDNKFPPNYIFFLFSCLWVSLFLLILYKFPSVVAKVEKYADRRWLSPFITSGYSIYLWQGVGYTAAAQAGAILHLPILAVWPLALVLSVGFGLLAAPAERVRLRL